MPCTHVLAMASVLLLWMGTSDLFRVVFALVKKAGADLDVAIVIPQFLWTRNAMEEGFVSLEVAVNVLVMPLLMMPFVDHHLFALETLLCVQILNQLVDMTVVSHVGLIGMCPSATEIRVQIECVPVFQQCYQSTMEHFVLCFLKV